MRGACCHSHDSWAYLTGIDSDFLSGEVLSNRQIASNYAEIYFAGTTTITSVSYKASLFRCRIAIAILVATIPLGIYNFNAGTGKPPKVLFNM